MDKNEIYKKFGERILKLRIEKDLTQKEIADQLGIAQQTYQGYETGNTKATLHLLEQLSSIYNVSMDFLAGKTEERNIVHECKKSNANLTQDEETLIELYRQLDIEEKYEIRGEMKGILRVKQKEKNKKELENA